MAGEEVLWLIRKLGHAVQVVVPGKTFLCRMLELKSKVGQSRRLCRLNTGVQSDIMWWATFLVAWNGVSMLRGHMRELFAHHAWTIASGSFGCRAWHPATGEWLQFGLTETVKPGDLETKGGGIAWESLRAVLVQKQPDWTSATWTGLFGRFFQLG